MIGLIVGVVLILLIVGFFVLTNNRGTPNQNMDSQKKVADPNQMVDCGQAEDPGCFLNRMSGCLPVTAKMVGTDGSTAIEITVLGQVNETCHFQRKLNNAIDMDCYFPKGTLNSDTLDQTFGNDKGLQKVVDDACKPVGW